VSTISQLESGQFDAVLFDLDGTLVDTAPDMVAVVQELQSDKGLEPLAFEVGRSQVSNGALGLLRVGFPKADEEQLEALLQEFLQRYEAALCINSTVYPGLGDLLDKLDAARRPWGVVTNKPARITDPLLDALNLSHRLACAVSGDTLATRKPDPGQLLFACAMANLKPERTVYVGDAARDIEAGRAAGMATIAVEYGYITADDDPATWDADLIVADPQELAQTVLKAVNLVV